MADDGVQDLYLIRLNRVMDGLVQRAAQFMAENGLDAVAFQRTGGPQPGYTKALAAYEPAAAARGLYLVDVPFEQECGTDVVTILSKRPEVTREEGEAIIAASPRLGTFALMSPDGLP